MFQTLGYFLELTVSIYFFCVVMLFMINVCEFMPLTAHEVIVEEKILIRTPSKPNAPESKAVRNKEDSQDDKSKAARERWKNQLRKLPESKSWDKVTSNSKSEDQRGEVAGGQDPPEKWAQPDTKSEQSPEAPVGIQEPQERPADDSPVAAPADDGTAATAAADDGTAATAAADDGTAPTAAADDGLAATPADDGPAATPADDGPAATPADDGPAATPADDGPAATHADDGLAATPADDDPAATPADDGPAATPAANDVTADPPNNDPTDTAGKPEDADAT